MNYELKEQESFELEDIFECGQCFRWNREPNGSYTGVIKNAVINVQKDNGKIIFSGNCIDGDFETLIRNYFDLDTNYNELKKKLSEIDENLDIATKFGERNSYFKSRFMGMYYIIYYFGKQQYS